jgi:flagellar FliJ protein
MPRFHFRLDPVLEQRERVEEQRKRLFSEKERAFAAAIVERDRLHAEREGYRTALRRDHAAFDVDRLRATYAYLDALDRRIGEQVRRCEAARAEVDTARAALIAASRDRKVLETLKQQRRDAHAAQAAQAEQREFDDQNARQFGRSQLMRESG